MRYVQYTDGQMIRKHGIILEEEPERIYEFELSDRNYDHDFPWAQVDMVFPFLLKESREALTAKVKGFDRSVLLENYQLMAPIHYPRHDVICVGLNYKDHVQECNKGLDIATLQEPTFFSKRASKIYTDGDDIPFCSVDSCLDYEVELAVIIGKTGVNIPESEVKDHILGYAVYNDFSARTIQKATSQWVRGKGLDGLSAMSSSIVFAKDMPYPPELPIKSYVNGELRQNSNTDNFIYSLDYLISQFSQGCTLEAGDIIITGTPAGVGMGMDPPQYLKKGDVVTCEIEGVGSLTNKLV